MGLVFKNIKNSFCAYKNIYFLLIISQIIAIMILMFTYCVSSSAKIRKKETENLYGYSLYCYFKDGVSVNSIREILPSMLDEMDERLQYAYYDIINEENDMEVTCLVDYKNGKYCNDTYNFPDSRLYAGRYMDTEELNDGSKVALGFGMHKTDPRIEFEGITGIEYQIGDVVEFCGEEYQVVGIIDGPLVYRITIPIPSCTDEMMTNYLSLDFDKLITENDYFVFEETLKRCYGTAVEVCDFEVVEMDDIINYNTVIMMAFVIGMVAALDTVLVYNYILKKRRRQMAIWSVAGADRKQRIYVCMMEILIITSITTLIGVVIFKLGIENILMKVYEIGIEVFGIKTYVILIGIYIGCLMLGTGVMVTINTRKGILDLGRG